MTSIPKEQWLKKKSKAKIYLEQKMLENGFQINEHGTVYQLIDYLFEQVQIQRGTHEAFADTKSADSANSGS